MLSEAPLLRNGRQEDMFFLVIIKQKLTLNTSFNEQNVGFSLKRNKNENFEDI